MLVEAQVTINGSQEAVWKTVTNIENAAQFIRGIEKIEIIVRPAHGLVGLKWRETRILFGKPAAVDKWITEALEPEYFKTQAEDSGFLFLTTNRLSAGSAGTVLTSGHETRPQGLAARLKSLPMFLFKGMIRKAILQDLNDIKNAAERE